MNNALKSARVSGQQVLPVGENADGEITKTVPTYAPRPGHSVADVAKELGGRLLSRKEWKALDEFELGNATIAIVDDDLGGAHVVQS